jgi:tetratricopeptide (TPR) repeat protein
MTDYPYDLGSHSFPITTDKAAAQTWFDRGLTWTYGFNHDEAIACFKRALKSDPSCAMAYWGIAYAAGPNYNMPWSLYDDRGRANALSQARDATEAALALLDGQTAVEAALIQALSARYPQTHTAPIAEMETWDRAFAQAMGAVHKAHPGQLDVASVYVEALMNLTPWKMWDLKSGIAAKGAETQTAQDVLETAFDEVAAAWAHPGLLHLYVHLMEMSPTPEKALKAADVLRTLVPDAGHLVHMPTHIDVLCGAYRDAVYWNQKAVEADLKYYSTEGAFNIYTGYRQHNYHFVIYAALFLGQIEPALHAAKGMTATVPEDMLRIKSPPMADFYESYMHLTPHILVRFGRWDNAIALEPPEDQTLFCTGTAYTHYARTIAFAATGRVAEAEAEEKVFLQACDRVPASRLMHNNRVVDLLDIAKAMCRGEISYRKGEFEAAFAALRQAVACDDALPYDEPWGWMQPARHALGALLFEQGHLADAETVYREDLGLGGQLSRATVHPDNVWSLKGLHDCLKARGSVRELPLVRQKLDLALSRADQAVAASCFCAQAAMSG